MGLDFGRILVIVGNYGSGKTECALEIAARLRERGPVTLVDLDIVNPYFRSSAQRESLEAQGIRVIAPVFANTSLDVPALPAEIVSVFEDKTHRVVFDVGGDPTGATALGRYAPHFKREQPDVWMVVNPFRPLTGALEDMERMIADISARARLPVTGLVSNANIARETTAQDLLEGHALIEELSAATGIPIAAIAAGQSVIDALPEDFKDKNAGRFLPLELRMRPDWLD